MQQPAVARVVFGGLVGAGLIVVFFEGCHCGIAMDGKGVSIRGEGAFCSTIQNGGWSIGLIVVGMPIQSRVNQIQ